jgi:enoyl-CoA hydratase/carnithine racemase
VAEVLADLRKGGPQALAHAKSLVYRVPRMDPKDAFAWATRLSGELFASDEAAAGVKAFLTRSLPPWATEGNE